MSKEDIEKAVKEAEMYAETDKKQRESVETKNQAEQMIYQSEKTLSEIGDKLPDSDKQPVRDALEKLKETVKTDDTAAIKADPGADQGLHALPKSSTKDRHRPGADAQNQPQGERANTTQRLRSKR